MRLSRTVFEILSLILQNVEVTWQWPRPFQGQFVVRRLGLAMFNPHIKFEMSTITCNEEMKGNAKWKNSRFEPPFGGLKGDTQGSTMARWKARGRLPISANWIFLASSHGCGTIKRLCRNLRFLMGWSHWAQICGRWGRRPQSIHGPLDRGMTWLQLCRWKFSHKETL